VHVAHLVELAHRSVDNGEASAAFFPGSEMIVVVLPFNIGVLVLEGLVHADEGPVG
jgi:hypothetical protein